MYGHRRLAVVCSPCTSPMAFPGACEPLFLAVIFFNENRDYIEVRTAIWIEIYSFFFEIVEFVAVPHVSVQHSLVRTTHSLNRRA